VSTYSSEDEAEAAGDGEGDQSDGEICEKELDELGAASEAAALRREAGGGDRPASHLLCIA
jgi:hypothetical protein